MPERARPCIFIECPMGLCSVLDELQAFGFADLLQCFNIARLAEKVDPDYGFRPGRDLFSNLTGVDIEGIFFNIGKDRFCAAHSNGGRRGHKREGRDNDLVPRADSGGEERGMQCRRPVVCRDCMVRTTEIGKFFLEL